MQTGVARARGRAYPAAMDAASPLLPKVLSDWFAGRGWSPRAHQLETLAAVRGGDDALLIAPTGGGKTLGGFLYSLSDLIATPPAAPRLHTLYISPLKALTTDVGRNLLTPARDMGLGLRIETRTGDTPQSKRARQKQRPPDILLTTPEQICLLIASEDARLFFEDLKTIIIDEIHAIAPTKRGDLLALALSAVQAFAPDARRIGLSATVDDPDRLARWLSPLDRAPAHVVRGAPGAKAEVTILDSRERIPWAGQSGRHVVGEVYEAIRGAKTTLVFVNTRSQAELMFQELWSVNEDALPIALHHGSLSVEQRRKVEGAMTRGALRAVVCTSTLDLGVDWGDVDLVIQIGAPKGASRLVQRIGRANHRLDAPSRAILAPTNRFEVLECRAAKDAVDEGALDGPGPRTGALDALAQHVMGRACGEPFLAEALFAEVSACAPYATLPREAFDRIVAFVSDGGYALKTYDRFRRIVQGPDGRWRARSRETKQRHRMNVGAIVESPMLDVRLAGAVRPNGRAGRPIGDLRPQFVRTQNVGLSPELTLARPLARAGRKLGQIEEWFVEQLTPGDTFLFAGEILKLQGIVDNDVLVSRSTDKDPKIPSYNGGKFPLSTYLAARVRAMTSDPESWKRLPDQVRSWFEMQALKSRIPDPDELLVETFPRGRKHYLVTYPFDGRLAHQTLGMLLTRRLERAGKKPLGFVASEYAVAVWSLDPMGDLDMRALFHQDMLGDDLEAWLDESQLMKRTFRQCALISGLIERRLPGQEKTGRQVTFSADLIYDVLRSHEPDHILLQAARQDAGEGLLDIRRLGDALARIAKRITHLDLPRISPFAVPVMLEVGREPVYGEAGDAILAEAAEDLEREAFEP